jgi:hypothetical protein
MNTKVLAKVVPQAIKDFVFEKLQHNIRNYSVCNRGYVEADIPWHEADREYYQLFKLTGDSSKLQAEPVPFSFSRSGWQETEVGQKVAQGKADVPSGFVIVMVGTYPRRCTIYTALNQNPLLESKTMNDEKDLQPSEVIEQARKNHHVQLVNPHDPNVTALVSYALTVGYTHGWRDHKKHLKLVDDQNKTHQDWCSKQQGCVSPGSKPCTMCRKAWEAATARANCELPM